MANPDAAAALQEVAAAIHALADTLREPLLQAASALNQVEATLASLDGRAVAGLAASPAGSAANNGTSAAPGLVVDEAPKSPKSPQGPTTGRRLSQAASARHSSF